MEEKIKKEVPRGGDRESRGFTRKCWFHRHRIHPSTDSKSSTSPRSSSRSSCDVATTNLRVQNWITWWRLRIKLIRRTGVLSEGNDSREPGAKSHLAKDQKTSIKEVDPKRRQTVHQMSLF
uniref:Uncharacterized protein n=1 Tax=Caenorhabditis tropicalis TaxID=1561998 RepID=A0A1I7UQI2_9PELO